MPTLRWFGFSRVTSLPPTRMAPEVGSSKPATILSTVVLPQPDGPRNETNSPGAASRLKSCTTVFWPKDFLTCWIERKGSAMVFDLLDQRVWFDDFGAKRESSCMTDMQAHVMAKA